MIGGRKAERDKVRKALENRTWRAARALGNLRRCRWPLLFTQKIQVCLDKRQPGALAPHMATVRYLFDWNSHATFLSGLGTGRCPRAGQIPLMPAAILLTLGDKYTLRSKLRVSSARSRSPIGRWPRQWRLFIEREVAAFDPPSGRPPEQGIIHNADIPTRHQNASAGQLLPRRACRPRCYPTLAGRSDADAKSIAQSSVRRISGACADIALASRRSTV